MNESATHIQFDDIFQQRHATGLGMWIFLATEVLFFGGLFLAYTVYRIAFPSAFAAMSDETNIWLGTINTAVLLTSSLFMAKAVQAARNERPIYLRLSLTATMVLGICFLFIKGIEYHEDFKKHLVPNAGFPYPERGKEIFFWIYYAMTGLHALHLTIGIGIVAWAFTNVRRKNLASGKHQHVLHVIGLYWHFVDTVWLFLYPLLYLVGRSK
jgi:cytochrome c oxidase subunit 3